MDLDPREWTISHDFAFVSGGAEWVTRCLSELVLPGAPVRFIGADDDVVRHFGVPRGPDLLGALPVTRWNHRWLAPLYPVLLRRARPAAGHLLASSYAFCHVVPSTGMKVVYCHSPLRHAWSGAAMYTKGGSLPVRMATRLLGGYFRHADQRAAESVTAFIATSRAVRDRIHLAYGVADAPIVPPPFDERVFTFDADAVRDGFLWVGRIAEPYKRLSLAIEVMRDMPNKTLTVVGEGRDRARLQRTAPSNVRFLGWRSAHDLVDLYRSSEGLFFPGEDDFGIVPVEAMACGTPVIAYRAGGALDTVEEGFSGVFFDTPSVESLGQAIKELLAQDWDHAEVASRTSQVYSRLAFQQRMTDTLRGVVGDRDR
ncbi:glycosyltransferase [Geodermatophilus maliterrae]|uniref:Glycosyltransferase n=1 Tax=Geodermatophilus maliterrae TaxID=3162531 RepID=A0ABV3XHT1_9ACTN